MKNQLTKGENRRVMYIENKDGMIDDHVAHIGWVSFSKTGKTVYYQDKVLHRIKGGGVSGNHIDETSGHEYWVSGIKKHGANTHWAKPVSVKIDVDAKDEYLRILGA